VITGAKSQTGGFKGAPTPSRSIFIYRVSKDTELNELRTYIADLGVKDIRYLDCVSHVDAKFQSFKLTVPVNDHKELLDGSLWPEGVRIRDFFTRRETHQQNNDNGW
jgi:hypothetical protein